MVDIEKYMSSLISLLQNQFGERLLYVGLQGSYLRGEATECSDIDIMVVVDLLSVSDLDAYRTIIASMDYFDRSCGFICSKEDLLHWNHLEMCNLLHSTKDYFGKLCDLIPEYTREDIHTFVKLSINNLYHEICHRYIHGNKENIVAALPGTYKGVFFILQNFYYLKSGEFITRKAELLKKLDDKDRDVLARSIDLGSGNAYDFEETFALLFSWCQETLSKL
ncbi:MAG: nucleotidyltransferase domain-containing protein [Oscillospiraceae bacterium]|nr:nucleotidyltransferase domain-containing protein [Oscillospiraceae bacterium]